MWPLRVKVPASDCWRENERTMRIPPKASVAWESICWRVQRMSRKIGRIRLIQVRCVSQTVGNSASEPSKQPPIDGGENRQAAEQLDDRAPRVVDHGEDQVGDAAGVFTQDGRDAAGFQFVHAMQRKADGVVEDGFAHTDTCTRLVMRVACQRLQRLTISDATANTIIVAATIARSPRGLCGR